MLRISDKQMKKWIEDIDTYDLPAFRGEQTLSRNEICSIYRLFLDQYRGVVQFLVNTPREATVLYLPCVYGGAAISFARNFEQVMVCDPDIDKLRLLKRIARRVGCDNIKFTCIKNVHALPLQAHSFDAIFMDAGDDDLLVPEHSEQSYATPLREMRQLLKDGGQYFIVAKNEIYTRILERRKPELCARSRFLSLLHSLVSSVKLWLELGSCSQINTIHGWEKLLEKANLNVDRIYSLIPERGGFSQITRLPNGKAPNVSGNFHNPLQRIRDRLLRSRVFTPYFAVFASLSKRSESLFEELIHHIDIELFRRGIFKTTNSFRAEELLVSDTGKLIIMLSSDGTDSGIVIRVPYTSLAIQDAERNSKALLEIHSNATLPQEVRDIVPNALFSGDYRGYRYFVEERIPGISMLDGSSSKKAQQASVNGAKKFITDLHVASVRKHRVDLIWFENIVNMISRIQSICQLPTTWQLLEKVVPYLENSLTNREIPFVWSHGDFCLRNCIQGSWLGELSGVIDWEGFSKEGLPLLDMFHLENSPKKHGELYTWKSLCDISEASESSASTEYVSYIHTMGISPDLIPTLAMVHWINYVSARIDVEQFSEEWMLERVYDPVTILAQYLIG